MQKIINQMVRFENETKDDISALYDGYKLTYGKVIAIEKRLDNQKLGMKVVCGGKNKII